MVAEGVFSTGRTRSYCTAAEVFKILAGHDLAACGGPSGLTARVEELLPLAKAMVDTAAGRDFQWHSNETLMLDGSGTDRMQLSEGRAGEATPALPVILRALRVEGQTLGGTQYRAYAETGLVRLQPGGSPARFPEGLRNVEADVDWGFQQAPGDVQLAQAKLTAAELMAELGGEGGMVQETRIGDYAVRYSAEGRYAGSVARWCAEAMETLRRYRSVRVGVV
jgi:hypothetical protein